MTRAAKIPAKTVANRSLFTFMKNDAIETIIVARNIRNINRSKHPQQFYDDENY